MPTAQDPLGMNENQDNNQNANGGNGPQKYSEYVVSGKNEAQSEQSDNQDEGEKSLTDSAKKINYIIPGFIAIVIITLVIIFWLGRENEAVLNTDSIPGQEISQEDFQRLAGEQAQIDSTNKKLIIAADAEFNGSLEVKESLDLAGDLNVGGNLSFAELTVSGQGTFADLAVGNDVAIQGSAVIQNNLSVSGNASISGGASVGGDFTAASITTGELNFEGQLQFSHIQSTGPTPSASGGTAIGSGGTVSISGNDTAGTVQANTGTGASSGSLVSVSFASNYDTTPTIIITPVGSDTADLNYYVTRNSGGFTIFTKNSASNGSNYTFDYFIIE